MIEDTNRDNQPNCHAYNTIGTVSGSDEWSDLEAHQARGDIDGLKVYGTNHALNAFGWQAR